MALMMSKLYRALLDAHVGEQQAREAAEELAGYENRFGGIESRLAVLTWMAGTNLVLTAGILWRLLSLK